MSEGKDSHWLVVFEQFIKHLRITSKEALSEDDWGSPLNLWGSQSMALREIAEGLARNIRTFVILKSRQLGISTITLAILIFWLATHSNMIAALVTDTDGNKESFRDILRRYVKSFPANFLGKGFQIIKGGDNRYFLKFSNGARLDFLVAGEKKKATWGESRGYALAVLTEVANYGDPAGLESFMETLAEQNPDRLFILESTAKGFNHWRGMYYEALRDTITKKAIFIGWWAKEINNIPQVDPRFEIYGTEPPDEEEQEKISEVLKRYDVKITIEQLAWYRWRASDKSKSEASLLQNNPWLPEEAFQSSGFSFFHPWAVQKDLARLLDTPAPFQGYRYIDNGDFFSLQLEQITDQERLDEVELKIWQEPVAGAQYVMGVDPAYGRNDWKDRHIISLWRCYANRMVQVAEYATHEVDTRHAAWAMFHLAGTYRDCIINLELGGGPGRAVMTEFDHLREMLQAEVYVQKVTELGWLDVLETARWFLYHRADSLGPGFVYNFETTAKLKFEMMSTLRDIYTTNQTDICSVELLREMLEVEQTGGSIEAPNRGKDDRVVGFGLAAYAWVKWRRAGLLAAGETFESVTEKEEQETPNVVESIVANFLRRAQEDADAAEQEPTFLEERGLVG